MLRHIGEDCIKSQIKIRIVVVGATGTVELLMSGRARPLIERVEWRVVERIEGLLTGQEQVGTY